MSDKPVSLIIEDDPDLADLLETQLRRHGFAVRRAPDLGRAHAWLEHDPVDVAVIDRNLPDGDGLELCKHLRSTHPSTGIIMLTCRGDIADRIGGLHAGADDYVAKPFSIEELMARVQSVVRRAKGSPATTSNDTVTFGDLVINPVNRVALFRGVELSLTATEFDLLLFLARNPGRAFSRSELLKTVWGYTLSGYEHTVNTHITRLRAKLQEDVTQPRYILTVWAVGYKFAEVAPASGDVAAV
jgi:DNA-binding response OmpR family regulator